LVAVYEKIRGREQKIIFVCAANRLSGNLPDNECVKSIPGPSVSRIISLVLPVILAVMVMPRPAAAAVAPAADCVEGEALVWFEPSQTLESARAVAARHGARVPEHYDWLSARHGHFITLLHATNLTTAALLAELKSEPAVVFAEPNYLRYPTDLRTPNDPKFSQLWGLHNTGQSAFGFSGVTNADISFLKAWGLARPATNEVVVGVIDTGLDPTHPDLFSNLWTNPGEIPSNNIDDDGNGYVDDIHGYDFALNTGALTDSGYHGTHVAGTIAAIGNNNQGVIGVDFQAHLMGLKVSSNGSNMISSAIVSAIQYAALMKNRGVNVVALNCSYGGGSSSATESAAMAAAGSAGIIFCVAAGNNTNNNDTTPFYPASYHLTNEIVVAASDPADGLANFSNYGAKTVDLAAPGVSILSCAPVSQPGYSSYIQVTNQVINAAAIEYSTATPSNGISGAIYYCGLGYSTNFPAAVSNNLALILRGTLTFAAKTTNAMKAGAKAVIIFNNTNSSLGFTLGASNSWIPALSLAQADGLALQASLPATGTVFNYLDPAMIYRYLDGTSMAAPHVSGAVAFAALNFPTDTIPQRIQRVLSNVTPVAALSGKTVTGGRLNLARIVDSDTNGLPDWWELQYFGHLTGTDPNGDPDHDGASNLAEFLAGTNPTNASSVLRLVAGPASAPTRNPLRWPSVAGRYYRILSGTNLASGISAIVQTNIAATSPTNFFTNTLSSGAQSVFYRLELEP
jgi:subtilisin family serine protease